MLKSSEIKQSLLGLLLSDGYLDRYNRFIITSKYEDFRNHCLTLFDSFPNNQNKVWKHNYLDKRFNTYTYILTANYPAYFSKFREWCYPVKEKELTRRVVNKIDARCLAYMWQGDGYLEHTKNKQKDSVQNVGWYCLESFNQAQLQYFCDAMNDKYKLNFRLSPVVWGKGFRPKISGEGLQNFISLIYPFVTDTFQYKTKLFYKRLLYCNYDLPSAEHIFVTYDSIKEYEEIVESYKKL